MYAGATRMRLTSVNFAPLRDSPVPPSGLSRFVGIGVSRVSPSTRSRETSSTVGSTIVDCVWLSKSGLCVVAARPKRWGATRSTSLDGFPPRKGPSGSQHRRFPARSRSVLSESECRGLPFWSHAAQEDTAKPVGEDDESGFSDEAPPRRRPRPRRGAARGTAAPL